MKIGPILLLLWFAGIATSILTVIVSAIRRGATSLKSTIPMFIGTLMLYGFISAGIGVVEGVWSINSPGLWIACAIGTAGLLSIGLGLRGLCRSRTLANRNAEQSRDHP